jgi:hypothetical protein
LDGIFALSEFRHRLAAALDAADLTRICASVEDALVWANRTSDDNKLTVGVLQAVGETSRPPVNLAAFFSCSAE